MNGSLDVGDAHAGAPMRQVRVAVLTFRRPADIDALLPLLAEQAASVTGDDTVADVIVVDNDPDAGARAAVTAFATSASVRVRYVHEPCRGIAAARNRALDESTAADLLCFIDDDERPAPGWLGALLGAYDRYAASAVLGPVVSTFAEEPHAWTVAGGWWERRRLPTGSRVEVGDTGNILIDLHAVRRAGIRFDERLGTGGGEDNLFTRRLRAAGGDLVWCDDAVAYDVIPGERLQPRWLIRRRFAMAANRVTVALLLAPSPARRGATRARFVAAGGYNLVRGLALWLAGTVTRRLRWRSNGTRLTVRGAGLLAGVMGLRGQQYR